MFQFFLFKKIFFFLYSECLWKSEFGKESDIRQRLVKENLESSQTEFCLQVLTFLSTKNELGATNVELISTFPNRKMLSQSLQLLLNLRMVLQAGVVEVTYVHCLYVTPWLVGTYNIKRLEREAVVPVPYQLMRITDRATPNEGYEQGESSSLVRNQSSADYKPLRPNRLTRVTIDNNVSLPTESQISSK